MANFLETSSDDALFSLMDSPNKREAEILRRVQKRTEEACWKPFEECSSPGTAIACDEGVCRQEFYSSRWALYPLLLFGQFLQR